MVIKMKTSEGPGVISFTTVRGFLKREIFI